MMPARRRRTVLLGLAAAPAALGLAVQVPRHWWGWDCGWAGLAFSQEPAPAPAAVAAALRPEPRPHPAGELLRRLGRLGAGLGRLGSGAARAVCFAARAGPVEARRGLVGMRSSVSRAPQWLAQHLRGLLPLRPAQHPLAGAAPGPLGRRQLFGQAEEAASDFFLFIKDYGWSLRYRARWPLGAGFDAARPLELDWVQLRAPVRDPLRLLQASSEELFNWDVRVPPRHRGFEYQVTRVVGSGVEAGINFLKGMGLSLLVQPYAGIRLLAQGGDGGTEEARAVTHAWVQCLGMPMLPVVHSVSFYDLNEVVLQWRASAK